MFYSKSLRIKKWHRLGRLSLGAATQAPSKLLRIFWAQAHAMTGFSQNALKSMCIVALAVFASSAIRIFSPVWLGTGAATCYPHLILRCLYTNPAAGISCPCHSI